MRTGGEDIAQALALMGVRPQWDNASRRVTGFEILPLDILDRPRVDVTLRISGFFRDAFPAQIDLFDSAVRAVAALDEGEKENPLAARTKSEHTRLLAEGVEETVAAKRAGYRIFGSKPGAYGAGLQALIDERGWESEDDLARAYIAWGGYAYGAGAECAAEHRLFEERLSTVEAVIHNQDNREHDLLDSDDYYQFEGVPRAPCDTRPEHSRRSITTTIPVQKHRRYEHSKMKSAGSCAPVWSIQSGSKGLCAMAIKVPSRWRRPSTISLPSPRPHDVSATTISIWFTTPIWETLPFVNSSSRTIQRRLGRSR